MVNHRYGRLFGILMVVISRGWAGDEPSTPSGEKALFEELPVVEAASLHVQNLEEAPASVTVISAAEIRKYGYRTLGEALAGVRGFDLTYDRIYHYVGVHGFSLPGDYNTRFLVMINGHSMTENVFSSNNFWGQDFGLDMDLVQRIEIIRGPSSALYGSNGMFATINVVTKSPVDQSSASVRTETDTFGGKKAIASSSLYLGHGANLLVAASAFNNRGQRLYIPEFDSPETRNGIARGVDGERGYHTFANLIWRGWDMVAYVNSREKQPPVAWDDTSIFGDRGNRVRDERDFLRVSHSQKAGKTGKIGLQVSYDRYRYADRFNYSSSERPEVLGDLASGDWLTSQFTYSVQAPKLGTLTLGAQANWDLRNLLHNYATGPDRINRLHEDHPDRVFSVFAQQEIDFSERWKAYIGLRFDDSHVFDDSISPRIALVHQRSPRTVYKFVYGHPFRNPSVFEQYYRGPSIAASTGLHPETAHTFEGSVERKLTDELTFIANLYDYRTRNLIQAAYLDAGLQPFRNSVNVGARGVEFELTGKPWTRLEATGSLSLQQTANPDGSRLPNSPRQVAKLRMSTSLFREKLMLSASSQYLGARPTLAGAVVRPVYLTDITATTNHLTDQFEVQFGIRNLFDRAYDDPVALAVVRMQGDGRSAFVKLIWRSRE
jgi:iron complex outermembrane receptor protein